MFAWIKRFFNGFPEAPEIKVPTVQVLHRAHVLGFKCKSDFARTHAPYVGFAASMGYITTQLPDGRWGDTWHITVKGLSALNTAHARQHDSCV